MQLSKPISILILNGLIQYKYALILPVMFLESVIVIMVCGFLVSLHLMNPVIALLVLIISDVVTDCVYYIAGRYGKDWRFVKYIIKSGNFETRKEQVSKKFHEHSGKLIFFGKLTHAFGMVILVGSGYFEINILRFIKYNLLAAVIKSSVLMYAGYVVGGAYARYATRFEYSAFVLVLLPVLLLVIVPIFIKKTSKKLKFYEKNN